MRIGTKSMKLVPPLGSKQSVLNYKQIFFNEMWPAIKQDSMNLEERFV
jgi:hypothetical protein